MWCICGQWATIGDLCGTCRYNFDARAEDRHNPDRPRRRPPQPGPPSDWEAAEEADRGEDRATRAFYGTHNEGVA